MPDVQTKIAIGIIITIVMIFLTITGYMIYTNDTENKTTTNTERIDNMIAIEDITRAEQLNGLHIPITDDEQELKTLETTLERILNKRVRCGYDSINSHKEKDEKEMDYRLKQAVEYDLYEMLDYIINFEIYDSDDDYNANIGGSDGEVHEIHYLMGNGPYIVIIDTDIY